MENTRLGNVRLIRKLGEGGMGAVWLGQHETLDKQVAVKILPDSLARDAAFCERFIREARAAAKLEHPNVIQVLDAAQSNGTHYIIMQFVEGVDLQKAIKKKGPLPVRDCLSIVKRVAAALAAAHELGMIHRDIKPSNIMVTGKGRVFVGDFGLARDVSAGKTVTGAEQVVGTPHYMSPEQARGERLDERSDMYSLGATLYAMLTARPPFEAETPVAVMVKHAREDQHPQPVDRVNPQVPHAVAVLVERMMAKDPKDRFADMKDVIAGVDAIKDGPTVVEPITKSPPMGSEAPTVVATPAHRSDAAVAAIAAPPKKPRWWIPAGIGAAAMLMALVCLGILSGNDPTPAELRFEEAQALEKEAGDDPDKLQAAADKYFAVAEAFPGSPEAAEARTKSDELRARIEETRFSRSVRDAAALPFAEAMEKIKAMKVQNDVPARDRVLTGALMQIHRQRLAVRVHQLADAGAAKDEDAIARLIAPPLRIRGEKSAVRRVGLAVAAVAKGRELVSITPHERNMEIDLGRELAEVKSRLEFKNAQGQTEFDGLVTHWGLHKDDWYVLPEKPADFLPPRRDQ